MLILGDTGWESVWKLNLLRLQLLCKPKIFQMVIKENEGKYRKDIFQDEDERAVICKECATTCQAKKEASVLYLELEQK